ncbi:MAG: hypothetical protein MI724_13785 [Spirochaetales bacterium]|nr:hypothetical protein [Spirochaetales bacterium]
MLFGAPDHIVADTLRSSGSLRLVWSTVTAGAVSAPPLDVRTPEGEFMLVTTEDRRVRLVDRTGETVSIAATGIRRPLRFLRERPGVFLVISDAYGEEGRGGASIGDAAIVRVRVAGRTIRAVGVPGYGGRGLVGDARFVSLDGEGNLYSFADPGLVGHGSTAGAMLWQRALPGGVAAVAGGDEAVYAALSDGRVFLFDSDGEGRPIVRWPSSIVDIAVAGGADTGTLLIEDDARRLSLVAFEERPRTLWSLDVAAGARDTGRSSVSFVALPIAVPVQDGTIRLMGRSDSPRWTLEARSPIVAIEPVHDGRGHVLVDADDRLLLVGEGGEVAATLRLRATPTAMWWLPEYRRLVVVYPDWRMHAFAVDGLDRGSSASQDTIGDGVPDGRAPSSVEASGTGALGALARAILDGPSVADRRALVDRLEGRVSAGTLYGAVDDYRSILAELLQEAYRNPRMRGGPIVNNASGVRLRAVAALAAVPDRASRVALTRSVRFDPDPAIAAAALTAIARYGVDEFGAFPHIVERFAGGSRREREVLAAAMVTFLEQTAVAVEDPPLASRALDLIARSSAPRDLRQRAVELGR